MDPRVLDAMLPYMVDKYGNPHSRTHAYGWETEDSVEIARKQARMLSPLLPPHCSRYISSSLIRACYQIPACLQGLDIVIPPLVLGRHNAALDTKELKYSADIPRWFGRSCIRFAIE